LGRTLKVKTLHGVVKLGYGKWDGWICRARGVVGAVYGFGAQATWPQQLSSIDQLACRLVKNLKHNCSQSEFQNFIPTLFGTGAALVQGDRSCRRSRKAIRDTVSLRTPYDTTKPSARGLLCELKSVIPWICRILCVPCDPCLICGQDEMFQGIYHGKQKHAPDFHLIVRPQTR
jgi:hypothetical protein